MSDQAGKDYYDRLTYVAADRSAKMLRDAGRHGIFLSHAGRYRLRMADALCPQLTLLEDADIRTQAPRPFRAVFLNYLLDCLPPTVVKVEGNQVQQLHVRTTIGKEAEWRASLDMTQDELLQLAASNNPADRRELMAVYHLLLSEYQYRPVEVQQVPYADFVVELACGVAGRPVLHNHGAIRWPTAGSCVGQSEIGQDLLAYVGCIAGAVLIEG